MGVNTGGFFRPQSFCTVSYTHLDVYKRQESAQARNDGGVFTVENWAVPMGEPVPPGVMDADDDESGSLVQVSVTLTDGDTTV